MNNILDVNNPKHLSSLIAHEFKCKRLLLNISQADLAKRAGVSLGSLKRFEGIAEISLKNLLKLAVILELSDFFYNIKNTGMEQESIKALMQKKKIRKRAGKND